MSQKYEKLKTLLHELFQLDQPDLDFGLYRIMHAKSAEVTQFLDEDLLPQVKEAFAGYKPATRPQIEKELAKADRGAQDARRGPGGAPKVKELRAQLAAARWTSTRSRARSTTISSLLPPLLLRGRLPQPSALQGGRLRHPLRGRGGQAPLGQQGPVLHQDQRVPARLRLPAAARRRRRTRCACTSAWSTPPRASTATSRQPRARTACSSWPGRRVGPRLRARTTTASWSSTSSSGRRRWPTGRAERDERSKPPKQKDLTSAAVDAMRPRSTGDELAPWIAALSAKYRRATDESERHAAARCISTATRRKHLRLLHPQGPRRLPAPRAGLLHQERGHAPRRRRERDAPRVEQYLSKIKVIRRIAGKIIDFLAQLEDFQKKLWLKKKFVVETSYLVTVGSIDETFLRQRSAPTTRSARSGSTFSKSTESRATWPHRATACRSRPRSSASPTQLVVDTRHFRRATSDRIVESFSDQVVSTSRAVDSR